MRTSFKRILILGTGVVLFIATLIYSYSAILVDITSIEELQIAGLSAQMTGDFSRDLRPQNISVTPGKKAVASFSGALPFPVFRDQHRLTATITRNGVAVDLTCVVPNASRRCLVSISFDASGDMTCSPCRDF